MNDPARSAQRSFELEEQQWPQRFRVWQSQQLSILVLVNFE